MRIAELLFLCLLVLYHAFLLVPRYRRPFALNYLVFLSGLALAISLGLEGLRWQMVPAILLLLVDLLVLFPTFSTLRGRLPTPGLGSRLGGVLRSVVASLAFLFAFASVGLTVMFPLPQVAMSGGLPVGFRQVHFPSAAPLTHGIEVLLWYPASGDPAPQSPVPSHSSSWQQRTAQGGLPELWQAYQALLPSSLVKGGRLAKTDHRYPVVVVSVPSGEDPADFSWLLQDLASRGFVVAGVRTPLPVSASSEVPLSLTETTLLSPFREPSQWLEPEQALSRAAGGTDVLLSYLREVLTQLDQEPGDLLYQALDLKRMGLLAWKGQPNGAPTAEDWQGVLSAVWLGDLPRGPRTSQKPELWVTAEPAATDSPLDSQRWILQWDQLKRADISDAAYLRPYLAFFGLKSQADGSTHALLREYLAAFFQYTLWGGDGSLFTAGAPPVSGVRLLSQ